MFVKQPALKQAVFNTQQQFIFIVNKSWVIASETLFQT